VKEIEKSISIFQSYNHKCTATFLWFTVYIHYMVVAHRETYHLWTLCRPRPI